jgi:succinate-acetate transporter protein
MEVPLFLHSFFISDQEISNINNDFAHALFTLFMFVCAYYSGVQHILCCVFVLFSTFCVPYVASLSGLSMFDCNFGIL